MKLKTSIYKIIVPCSLLLLLSTHNLLAQNSPKTEVVNGKTYIIHQVKAKETYYQLSRSYDVPVNEIIKANNNKGLKVGDSVRIPSSSPVQNVNSTVATAELNVFTEYKVGPQETLYSIAQRFQTTVEDIKSMNNLSSDLVREGQLIKIPDGVQTPPQPVIPLTPIKSDPIILPEARSNNLSEKDFETNKFGIREKTEKGIGIWMDNLATKNNSNLALHKTAPVGTVLKITNPITKNVTYAKVVGKFSDNQETEEAIVVLSKSAAAHIGVIDKRFLVEIAYGLPAETN